MPFVHVGFNSYANADDINAFIPYRGQTAQRIKNFAEETGKYVPTVGGKKTRSLIIFNNGIIMGSMWKPNVLAKRANMTLDEILSKNMTYEEDPDNYIDDEDEDDFSEDAPV